ncbi:uncharacterized protein [Temnothorax nylanderi]|uniref:uncharacterized protein n=1 Tax=Temnothorax nylanderi TaxID=102681 RepID=UPI003A8C00A2
MGSPLSPTLADIVMEDLEESVLSALDIHLSFYKRYVDDIIMKIPRDSVQDVLDHFNGYHDRLNFTIEYENNGRLSFLDLMLIVKGNTIITDWFHKETFSGRLLSFFSNHPIQHKIRTIYSLVDRGIMLSHPSFYNKNLNFVIKVLLGNGYPIDLIFLHINKRLRKLQSIKHNNTSDDSENAEKKSFIVIPYLGHTSEIIASAIDKSENSVGYRILNNLSSIIKVHKDKNAHFSNNDVVYKICCNNCDASYVGQTKRQLQTRLKEHKNNIRLDDSKHSVVSEHSTKFNHSFDWDNTRILEVEHNYKKRLTAEMIHIKEQINGINLNKDTELLNDAYFDILNRLS